MRLPRLFRAGVNLVPVGRVAQDQAERLLADAFRSLGVLCGRVADLVEAQRLARSGYGDQDRFLERLDRPAAPPPRK